MIQRFFRRLLFSRTSRLFIASLDSIVLPGFKGFSIYQISRFFARAINQGSVITRAAAISFKLFMAFFPMIILLLSLIPFIPIPDLENLMLSSFSELLPTDVYSFVEETLRDLTKKRSTLLSFSFLIVLYLASNSMNAILMGFSGSTNLTAKRNALKQRLLSIGLLIGLSSMLLVAILLITTSDAIFNYLHTTGLSFDIIQKIGVSIAKWLIILLLISSSIALLFSAGDTHSNRFQFISPGVILSTVLVILASQAMVWVFNNISNYNALYGSIGAIIAVQVWIYVNMIILLVGFELDTSIDKAKRVRDTVLRFGVEPNATEI